MAGTEAVFVTTLRAVTFGTRDMFKRYAAFVMLGRAITDICMIGCIWVAVYVLRFHSGLFGVEKGTPSFMHHLGMMAPVVGICFLGCMWAGLYRPQRIRNAWTQFLDIANASVFGGAFMLVFFYYVEDVPYSRKLVTLFGVMLFCGLLVSHLLSMAMMRRLRRKGYNLRYYAVIGAGEKGQQLVRDIDDSAWYGLKCACFVDNDAALIGGKLLGLDVCGPVEKLKELVAARGVDEVYLTMTGSESQRAYPVLEVVQAMGVTVRIVPDWGSLASTKGVTAVMIGSQVLFSAADASISETGMVVKEVFDRMMSLLALAVLTIPMALIALLVKATSKGPVFYRQTRVGMDGREFQILKFRTMMVDAEQAGGPQWANGSDPRRTSLGVWLRKTSLDELPQFINVAKGEMSLVGPRPERPCFVGQFSEEYRRYMLRYKVKAGMTGWAQINGLRGDTSLRKRLVYDLYYVTNWSLLFDLWILMATPWTVLKGKNAY
jgi:exopolysaccharide biosynthesis polyprenyl glycosylphosphotransferase